MFAKKNANSKASNIPTFIGFSFPRKVAGLGKVELEISVLSLVFLTFTLKQQI
ncbi:uncharacterized protein G2W53_005343 [Senna tora]|uniref:Uncharacterized protein n=1 Tax=Senna tora TaxID=362788 RepID=A0A835CK51_9FABA|nr:uncharacterized protein G2W53_005343 [Senna tora]